MNGEFPCGINKSVNMYWVYNKMPTQKPETPCHELPWTISGNISLLKNLPRMWNFPNFISGEKKSFLRMFWDSKQEKSPFWKRSGTDNDVEGDSIYAQWVVRGEATADFYQIRTFCHRVFNSKSLQREILPDVITNSTNTEKKVSLRLRSPKLI